MKKWIIPGILAGALLIGTLLVLACYFILEIRAAFAPGQATAATSVSTTVQTTTTETTTVETTTVETTTVETTTAETTEQHTQKVPEKVTTGSSSSSSTANSDYVLTASHSFVYDLSAEKYLYTYGDKNKHIFPASITKLFSAYVALQYLQPDDVITAGEEVYWIHEESSRAWIQSGHRLTVKTCVEGLIIPSGNDAAYMLAVAAGRAIAGDAQLSARAACDTFVAEMNRQAQALGLSGTHFANPDGIDADGHHTTLHDLVAIGRLALDNAVIRQAAATSHATGKYVSGQTYDWLNSNKLIQSRYPSYYCEEACGLKTGSTRMAGNCLLSAFKKDGSYLLVCVMGCPQDNGRFDDTLFLYEQYK